MEEATSDDQQGTPAKKGLSSEMIVALAAIVVSIMTLFVYIYQARIMVSQQHTSVWPHLEWAVADYSADTQEFYLSVINKGVGPALVKDSKLTLDGKVYTYDQYADFMTTLLGSKGKRDSLWITYSSIYNTVMAPGEEVKIFHVKSWQNARIPVIDKSRFSFNVCYCSIYDDCWSTDGTVSNEGGCK